MARVSPLPSCYTRREQKKNNGRRSVVYLMKGAAHRPLAPV